MFLLQNLPVEDIYMPSLNIRVRDNRTFGRRPIVGVHSVRSIQKYRCPTPQIIEEVDSGSKAQQPKGYLVYSALKVTFTLIIWL